MASENVKLRKRNVTVSEGYFYMIDEDQDSLLQKTDDGNTAFSYPLDTLISNQTESLEFDGVYFWSLEDSGTNDVAIRKWKIDNYVCKQQKKYNFTESGSHKYESQAFSIEHYHTTLTTSVSGGTVSGTLYLDKYSDSPAMSYTTLSGGDYNYNGVTLHLGPNTNGEEEDVEVLTTFSGGVTLTSGTVYDYASSDPVNFYTHIWMFNDFNGTSSSTGALYKFDAYTGNYIRKYSGGAYKSVKSATFYTIDSFAEFGAVDSLCYIKGTNTLFVDINETVLGSLRYYGSMVMENIKSDEATVITVYDMAMDANNMYRLQLIPDGTGTTWTYYSYLLSPLESFVTSISLSASPAIIAANGLSTSDILAVVKDQFFEPIVGRNVTFSENGSGSLTGGTLKTTDSNGRAETIYKSGTTAQEVKVTAVVEQT